MEGRERFMWKKAAWAVIRTILACVSVAVFGFALYYVSWGLNLATEWIMGQIVWIKDFVQNDIFAVVIIVVLFGIGTIVWDLLSSKTADIFQKIRNHFKK